MNNNINEAICQAIDTIVSKRLEAVSYDTTILCTIIDDSGREEGKYIVSYNDTAQFQAYSSDTTLRKNNNVYVQIPRGDWTEQKIIVGKKSGNEDEPYVVNLPFSYFLDMTGNLATGASRQGLVANQPNGVKTVWNSTAAFKEAGYTRLGVRAGFKSWLNPFFVSGDEFPKVATMGEYGIKLLLTGINKAGQTQNYELVLNTGDMNGNPYDFESFYQQEKIFNIEEIKQILSCSIQFYEIQNSFKDEGGHYVPYTDSFGNLLAQPNLFVDDIYLAFGYDISEYNDETAVIFTLDNEVYSNTKTGQKTVSLRWIHKINQSGALKLVDQAYLDELRQSNDIEIRWYRRSLGSPAADSVSGISWVRMADSGFSTTFTPDTNRAEEKIKAIVLFNGEPIRSNIITFENEDQVLNQPALDEATTRLESLTALSIVCEDKSFGNYYVYNYGNKLINSGDATIERYLKPQLKLYGDTSTDVTEAEWVKWTIPVKNTMIALKDTSGGVLNAEGTHITFTSTGNNYSQIYYIGTYYSPHYSNNVVQCQVRKDGIEYSASIELNFGLAGTTGSDFTFVLDFERNVNAVPPADSGVVNIVARLYNYDNEEISLAGKTIEWSWHGGSSLFAIPSNTADNYRKQLNYNGVAISSANYSVLTATLTYDDLKMTAYLPIPQRLSASNANYVAYVDAPSSVIYDSSGGKILDYYRNPLKAYYPNGTVISGVTWQITNGNSSENGYYSGGKYINQYTPQIKTYSGEQYFAPLNFYVSNTCQQICLTAWKNGQIIWSQPIFIGINEYPSSILNKWNGELVIDEAGGTILSPRLVAGSKGTDNKFSGVAMGDWSNTNSGSELTKLIGLYGYSNGQQAFAFKEDGSAFIGRPGAGRIEFDGTQSIIKSAAYDAGQGMQINLLAGKIDAHQFTLSAGQGNGEHSISINTEATTYPIEVGKYLDIAWDGTLTTSNIQIKGGTISSGSTSGMVIDVTNGTITSNKFKLTANGLTMDSSSTNPLTIGSNFIVNSSGNVTAKNINITGGNITGGGMTIDVGTGKITSNNFYLQANGLTVDSAGQYPLVIGNNFSVDSTGRIVTSSGSIGGWEIAPQGFKNANGNFYLYSDGTMVMGSNYHKLQIDSSSLTMGSGVSKIQLTSNGIDIGDQFGKMSLSSSGVAIGNNSGQGYLNISQNNISIGSGQGNMNLSSSGITIGNNSSVGYISINPTEIQIGTGSSPARINQQEMKINQIAITDAGSSTVVGRIGYTTSNIANDGNPDPGIGFTSGSATIVNGQITDFKEIFKITGKSIGMNIANNYNYYNSIYATASEAAIKFESYNNPELYNSHVISTNGVVKISPKLELAGNLDLQGNINLPANCTIFRDGQDMFDSSVGGAVYAILA